MSVHEIIEAIGKLPVDEQILVIKEASESVNQLRENELIFAVSELETEYQTNKELTVFSQIEAEDFYEAR